MARKNFSNLIYQQKLIRTSFSKNVDDYVTKIIIHRSYIWFIKTPKHKISEVLPLFVFKNTKITPRFAFRKQNNNLNDIATF